MPAGNTFTPIATLNQLTPVKTFTFSGIPQNFTDLLMTFDFATDRDAELMMRFNSDSGSNYGFTFFRANNSTSSGIAGGSNSQTYGAVDLSGGWRGSTCNILISRYRDTSRFKTYISRAGGYESSTINYSSVHSGVWRSTSAINSISITLPSNILFYEGNDYGIRASLYGILEA